MTWVNTKPRRKNRPRPAWKVQRAFHAWLRGRQCAMHQHQNRYGDCDGRMEAAHTPDPLSKGLSTKAADHNAIPLCQLHHKLHTNKGWSAIGLTRESARLLGNAYWAAWKGDKGDLA